MPGSTRYSATFDRTYEEEDPPPAPLLNRRSRSLSWQAESITNGRSGLGPLFNGPTIPHTRSSSTEPGATPKGCDQLAFRDGAKVAVKAHNNPFQFVKVSSCPLFKKPEDQMKKLQLAKAPAVKEEDEEEWQSNLDSWKSRRRKMSEGAFQRQDELRRLQSEDISNSEQEQLQQQQKKIKKFSEMVEQRATRGRAMSMCLLSNPLESSSDWLFESNTKSENKRTPDVLSEESATSSNINSDDDNENFHKSNKNNNINGNLPTTNGLSNNHISIQNSTSNSSISKNSDLSELDVSQDSLLSNKEQNTNSNGFIDSGIESLSSHRAGDILDSGSDFSQDSGSNDCDSPRTSGLITTEFLEEYGSKDANFLKNTTQKIIVNPEKPVEEKPKETSIINEKPKLSATEKKTKVTTKKGVAKEKPEKKNTKNKDKISEKSKPDVSSDKPNRSIDSENEMFVDDFEELARMKNAQDSLAAPISEVAKTHAPSVDETLNIVFQSSNKHTSKSASGNNNVVNSSVPKKSESNFSLISEIPVDKVTEEMERLILQQLEEEEQAKELSLNGQLSNMNICDDKNILDIPMRKTEPPKEKPPPPPATTPVTTPKKEPCIKRVNSTKRILKEINKRRTDFLGIENPKGDSAIAVLSLPPPPAMEDILKAEREQCRLTRQTLESAASIDEEEIARKEKEIIENVEKEERSKLSQAIPEEKAPVPDFTNARAEEEKIKQLQEERKKMEEELKLAEAKKARLEEEILLQKREDQVKKQEVEAPAENDVDKSDGAGAESAKSNVSAPQNGDGQTNQCSLPLSVEAEASKNKKSPPTPPPKPVKKKKDALRKERERLRQEQEELQREREEHRKKVQLEQEQMKKKEAKPHVPEASVSRVGPPTPEKPVLSPQVLTPSSQPISSSLSNAPSKVPVVTAVASTARTSASSGSVKDSSSQIQSNKPNVVKLRGRNAVPKAETNELMPIQKVPLNRKQELPGPRYNQNHWLIQEAEMRRIAELKERQRLQGNPSHFHSAQEYPEVTGTVQRPNFAQNMPAKTGYPGPGLVCSPDQRYGMQYNPNAQTNKCMPPPAPHHMDASHYLAIYSKQFEPNILPPAKPSRANPFEKQEQMLSVSGRKRCSHCGDELGRGAAMIIESLHLYYHIHCFRCCVCQTQLGNGSRGTDVRVRNHKLHCHNCYSNDEAGLKFSQV